MEIHEAFSGIATIFETNGTAIKMSREGVEDSTRWKYACRIFELEQDLELPDGMWDRAWKAYVILSLL